ncbi:RNA polymerase sigma factor SigJ [Kitasatospora paracochleata]|uniref:RNA polymerase sigma-70 factor (ECF subfamily) n=1 Tax=Kitasatospora paracochleata TaxID=58354 RepID=A0ABT1ITZ7_9ACTN|nr:sigma-70 family RNA polymerase sigma factor [Kitasatospora paracochleata]MCP2308413.1 RNA polymerase sigma-70 factor (ECF subfamily) [Kitasatospora paracochleata]
MERNELLAERFEAERGQLRAVAYRMLGSLSEAEDAVQEAWFRLDRADTTEVRNLAAWLTTVVGRVCLDMLRTRTSRREDPLEPVVGHVPEPVISNPDGVDPEQEALLADSVGLALLVVLDTLAPAERLAFVLHDMFAVPFEDIAPIVDKSPAATRQLASRARRRVQGVEVPDGDLARQAEVVDAFLAAARGGEFDALVALLDPDVVLRVDTGVTSMLRGAALVANQALMFRQGALLSRRVLVNGLPGMVALPEHGPARSVMGLTIRDGRIVEIYILADPERLATLDLSKL